MIVKKQKGHIAELAVATRLTKEGWNVLFPYGDWHRYDMVIEKDGRFLRVQVKYVTPKNGALAIRCYSSNNWSVKAYSRKEIDIMAAFDANTEKIYFIPVTALNGKTLSLRVEKTRNNQYAGVHPIEFYQRIPDIMQRSVA